MNNCNECVNEGLVNTVGFDSLCTVVTGILNVLLYHKPILRV